MDKGFHYFWTELADPRTHDWLLVGSIYQVPLILFIYLFVVLYWGPWFMKYRSSKSLQTFMKIYNVFQIMANAWLVRELFAAVWMKDIPSACPPIIFSYEPHYYKYAQILWWVFVLKIVDCTETVVFILRKKTEQISFLHIYHHITTILAEWMAMKYFAGEITAFNSLINCSIHVLMYTYYFLATFGPRIQKIISPLKRYITILQMVQFCVMVYTLQIVSPNCLSSNIIFLLHLGNLIINFYLFYKFYQKTYISSNIIKQE